MILAKEIIKKIVDSGEEAYFSGSTALSHFISMPVENKIYIATSAKFNSIKTLCKNNGWSCDIHNKINKLITEILVENKYILRPFIKTIIKNNYALRSYSLDKNDFIKSSDFTINSLLCSENFDIVSCHENAQEHIKNKIICFAGAPLEKIVENRVFMLNAGILLSKLGKEWQIEYNTYKAIKQKSLEVAIVSNEDIRDSFTDILVHSDKPSLAFRFYKDSGILEELIPQLVKDTTLPQSNKASNLDLFEHTMLTLDSVGKNVQNYVALRWASIFHDIAKPYTKNYDSYGNIHFLGHDKIGAIFASKWLEAYKFDKNLINKVFVLCKHHLFNASLNLTDDAILRLISRVGKEHILDLISLREADRHGTGRKDISMKKVNILRFRVKKLL